LIVGFILRFVLFFDLFNVVRFIMVALLILIMMLNFFLIMLMVLDLSH